MFTRIRSLRPVDAFGLVGVGVVITLVLSGTAIAVTDTNFTYSTTKTGYLTIHPMDLAPANNLAADNYYIDFGAGLSHSAPGGGCYNTGVNLPQLAKVISVQTYYVDEPTGNMYVYLYRNNLSTDVTDTLATQYINDNTGVRSSQTTTVGSTQRTVWNNTYAYGFAVCLGADSSFEGTRITYTYTSAGD